MMFTTVRLRVVRSWLVLILLTLSVTVQAVPAGKSDPRCPLRLISCGLLGAGSASLVAPSFSWREGLAHCALFFAGAYGFHLLHLRAVSPRKRVTFAPGEPVKLVYPASEPELQEEEEAGHGAEQARQRRTAQGDVHPCRSPHYKPTRA